VNIAFLILGFDCLGATGGHLGRDLVTAFVFFDSSFHQHVLQHAVAFRVASEGVVSPAKAEIGSTDT